jgi:hypothetical protein
MAPTREELLRNVKKLPPSYQKAIIEALETLDRDHRWDGFEEPPAEEFTTSRPPTEQVATSSPPPAGSYFCPPGADPWPGYIWFLEKAPLQTLREIAIFGNYWKLGHKERAVIRERLGCTSEDVIQWRGDVSASSWERTGPPAPEGRKESNGDSARPR